MSFGEKLMTLRVQKNISQRALAQLTGVSHSTISRIEADTVKPDLDTAEKIAKALDIPVSYFIDKSKDRPDFSDRLDYIMRSRNLSVEDVSNLVHQSEDAIFDLRIGIDAPPPPFVVNKFANAFGVNVDYMLGIIDDPSTAPTKTSALTPKAVPIIDSLERNAQDIEDLTDDEIKELANQMEFTIKYVKNKRNSR